MKFTFMKIILMIIGIFLMTMNIYSQRNSEITSYRNNSSTAILKEYDQYGISLELSNMLETVFPNIDMPLKEVGDLVITFKLQNDTIMVINQENINMDLQIKYLRLYIFNIVNNRYELYKKYEMAHSIKHSIGADMRFIQKQEALTRTNCSNSFISRWNRGFVTIDILSDFKIRLGHPYINVIEGGGLLNTCEEIMYVYEVVSLQDVEKGSIYLQTISHLNDFYICKCLDNSLLNMRQ